MDSMAEWLERWNLHTGDPRSNPGETKNFFSDFKNCFMVYEFYRNPTVGFLKFYFTKYEFLPSPGHFEGPAFLILRNLDILSR